MSDNTLPEIGEKYLRNPVLLQTPEGDDFTDEAPAKWAWFSHGYDTGMEPFYSAGQLKEAMEAAWTASRSQALEEAALIAERMKDPQDDGWDACLNELVAAFRKLGAQE